MNSSHNKSLASLLSRRIFIYYFVLAVLVTLSQIYLAKYTQNSNSLLLIGLAGFILSSMGLWFILRFVVQRFLSAPLQQITARMAEHLKSPNSDAPPELGLNRNSAREFVELHKMFCELANKPLAIQKEAAEAVQLSKMHFLSAASHDLRQPMHAFNLYLASFASLEMSKPVQSCVDNLNKCAKAMNDMLDTLLEISNIDAGATQAHLSIFPIASPIDRIQTEFQPMAQAKGITLRVARCSAFVESDEEIIERILRHLLSNAIRYTQRGTILIGCRRRGTQLRVAVYDTGLGIAADKQQDIFEAHFQLNNNERNRAKGLGLGLSIVQRLTKLLKTSITLHSKPDVGSTFAFDLPLVDLDAIEPIKLTLPKNFHSELSPPNKLNIVVIDDEPLILDATQAILEGWGHNIIAGSQGQKVLEQLTQSQQTPDLILCDYLLGDEERGVEVINMLRAAFKRDIPAFLVTGITLTDHIQAIQASGLNYVFKPLDYDQLRGILSQFTSLTYDQ